MRSLHGQTATKATYLHGVGQHPRQPEWDLFRELLSGHGDLSGGRAVAVTVSVFVSLRRAKQQCKGIKVSNLKAVSEVDVQDLAAQSIQHQVGRMPEEREREGENSPAAVLVIV